MLCRCLVAQESTIIPARNEVDVPTLVIYNTLSASKLERGCMHTER